MPTSNCWPPFLWSKSSTSEQPSRKKAKKTERYFHCTQGKDRTGLATAYLLSALGVDQETIIADFDKTNQVYARDVRKFCRRVKFFGGKEEELAVVKAFIGANTENFIKALDLINTEYGSMDAYLRNILGLTNADFEILKGRYLTSTKD